MSLFHSQRTIIPNLFTHGCHIGVGFYAYQYTESRIGAAWSFTRWVVAGFGRVGIYAHAEDG